MNKLYGNETESALSNFPFSFHPVNKILMYDIVRIKKSAARANLADGGISAEIAVAIEQACDEILRGNHDDQFVVNALQGGAGTSINMNANEIIASLATQALKSRDIGHEVHPLDHVNKSQSTNDVNPSALRISCIRLIEELTEVTNEYADVLEDKSREFANIPKLGRTHLQDAVPMSAGNELEAHAFVARRHIHALTTLKAQFFQLSLGGTAIGTGINASATYIKHVYEELRLETGYDVTPMENFISGTSSQTDFVRLSQAIVAMYVDLSKFATDIRLLASGPRGGIGELLLPKLQKGSTIMPGKVNPVIPEVVNQIYFVLTGYEKTIECAAEASQLQLGIMFPILADYILNSLILAREGIAVFTQKCLTGIDMDAKRCRELLENSSAYATVLTPILGYDIVSRVVEKSNEKGVTILDILKEENLLTPRVSRALEGGKNI